MKPSAASHVEKVSERSEVAAHRGTLGQRRRLILELSDTVGSKSETCRAEVERVKRARAVS